MSDRDTIKALSARRVRMDQTYHDWEDHFRELRKYIEPTIGRFELDERRDSSSINKAIIDPTARLALRTLSSGLMAGMTSPSRPWFRIGVANSDTRDDPEVKEWAHVVEKRMYEVLRGSNAYRMLERCYNSLGMYGTFGGMVVPDFEDVIHCHSFPMGRFRLASGEKGKVGYLHRDCRMTVANVIKKFGMEKVSNKVFRAYKANRMHDIITIQHAAEVRMDRDAQSPLAKNKPFANYYWEKQADTLLEESGFGINPILAPRWLSVEDEPWSVSSPGMMALGDSMQLQVQHRDKAIAIKKSYDPPLQGGSGVPEFVRLVPGGVTATGVNDLNAQGLRPIYEVRPDISGLREDIYETQRRIKSAFFEDLFLMTSQSDRRQVTATEIAERHEEKLLILGPVLESMDHDLLQPLIQATFHYMQQAEILPDPPESIVEQPIKVEYISALAQAQKAVGVAPMERVIGFAATLEQIKPGTVDAIDADQALRDFADQVGPPPAMLHTQDEVDETRAARAEQEEQAAMMEQVPQMAQAAKLISEASARGEQGIQRGSPL